ncbi:MAG: hypothetical protein PHC61_16060 [Chitinivibrionales bacterium]|nr:hypothetical protein [Chitinivibrionales bacterium]
MLFAAVEYCRAEEVIKTDIPAWLLRGPVACPREQLFLKFFVPAETIVPNDGDSALDKQWKRAPCDPIRTIS